MLTSASTRIAPSGSLWGQDKSADPKDIQPGSPFEMMPSVGVSKQSPTTGLVGARLPAA